MYTALQTRLRVLQFDNNQAMKLKLNEVARDSRLAEIFTEVAGFDKGADNMNRLHKLEMAMIEFMSGDPRRIQHFVKVHALSRLLGKEEELSEQTLYTLEAAALVHDIGIRPGEEKYGAGKVTGKIQEEEGPEPARELLTRLGFDSDTVERVAFLVGHHHTYDKIDGPDYQILVEADFMVNMYEDHCSKEKAERVYKKIFKTRSGRKMCRTMFGLAVDGKDMEE